MSGDMPRRCDTRCSKCSRPRFSGYAIQRGEFTIPLCSSCFSRLFTGSTRESGDFGIVEVWPADKRTQPEEWAVMQNGTNYAKRPLRGIE